MSYTSCDIEVWLTDLLVGMDTTGIDEQASNALARAIARDAIADAYPQHSVYVHMAFHTSGPFMTVERCTDDVDMESLSTLVSDALADSERWFVEFSGQGVKDDNHGK
jgi:hypothetical protein